MQKLSDDRLYEIGALVQQGTGLFCLDTVELLCLCLELRSLRSIMRSVKSHDEYLRIEFAKLETNQMPLPGIDEILANPSTVAEAMLAEANQTFYHEKKSAPIPLDPLCECGHTASDHVGRTGPCRRTPCGVKCRCDVMTVKV